MRNFSTLLKGSACLLFSFFITGSGFAQWSSDPAENTPVCHELRDQNNPVATADGNGGMITAWTDRRTSYSDANIYIQRIDRDGNMLWGENGKVLCDDSREQRVTAIIGDGMGGAFIAWSHSALTTNNDIYIQRIDSLGNALWIDNGIAVCDTSDYQGSIFMSGDGNGGVILSWYDDRSGHAGIYAQRVSPEGGMLWRRNGMPVHLGSADFPRHVPDGSGGAIFGWQDNRGDYLHEPDIYVQRINSEGEPKWDEDGLAIAVLPNEQWYLNMVSDTEGGATIFWSNRYKSQKHDLYVQKVDSNGSLTFPPNGKKLIDSTVDFQNYPISDGNGGYYVAWADSRLETLTDLDIRLLHLDADANPLWDSTGIVICDALYHQYNIALSLDPDGGVILAWEDNRDYSSNQGDIYAQKVQSDGTIVWPENGVPVSTASSTQFGIGLVTIDTGKAIGIWTDYRNSPITDEFEYATDIYASVIPGDEALPLEGIDFDAKKFGPDDVLITWRSQDEHSIAGFEVQKAFDGKNFQQIGSKSPLGGFDNEYQMIDEGVVQMSASDLYYRLKITDLSGHIDYSAIKHIKVPAITQPVFIWPNPGGDKIFFRSAEAPQTIDMYNINGQKQGTVLFNKGTISLPPVPSGIYSLVFNFKSRKEACMFNKL